MDHVHVFDAVHDGGVTVWWVCDCGAVIDKETPWSSPTISTSPG